MESTNRCGLAVRALLLPLILLCSFGKLSAEDYLSSADRMNGSKTLGALRGMFDGVRNSLVTIGYNSKSERPFAVGVAVSSDGLIITKASEFIESSKVRVYTANGKSYRPTVLDRDQKHDLLLLRIFSKDLKPISWGTSDKIALGNWIASASADKGIRLGAVSAKRRPIARSGGAIGVMLGQEYEEGGVKIDSVAPRGSAKAAGLKAGDVIKLLNGKTVKTKSDLIDAVKARNPGDRIDVDIVREGKPMSFAVTLRSRSALLDNWERDPMMGGLASKRVDDYPEVIQHDTPLDAAAMGGLLLDLEGRVIGMNIARLDRVTTFALPAEIVRDAVDKLIAAAPKLPEPPAQVVRKARGRNSHYR